MGGTPAVPQERGYPSRKDTLENHRYRLTFDEGRGIITKLYDKRLELALALDRGARCLPVGTVHAGFTLPEGMQILTMKPVDGKWRLALRDTAMTERETVLAASGWDITQVDLRGGRLDEKEREKKTFSAVPFGIYAFELERSSK